jgi:PPP family 3-phenylpropionic acid transporter
MEDMYMRNIVKQLNPKLLHFASLEFFFWIMCAAYYPFVVVYLSSKGYNNTTIGMIMAVNSFVLVFAQPFWGMVSDWLQSVKKVFIILLTVSACIYLSVPLYNSAFIIGIVLAVLTFFESSMAPLLDSWVVQGTKSEESISYGSVRLWGSIGFAIMVYIFGKMTNIFSINILFPSYAIFAVLTILICIKIKTDKPVVSVSFAHLKVGKLFKNYYYIVFLIFATVLFIPHRSAFIFMPKLIEELGGSKVELGIAYSVMALCEAPIFLFSKYLTQKFKPVQMILLSTIFFTIRQLLFSIATAPIHAILIQSLQGPSFALFLAGTVYYIDSHAPQELKAFAQTFASAIFAGIGGIIASYGGGWVIDNLGLVKMYQLGIIISIVISIIFILSFPVGKLLVKTADIKE